MTNEHIIESVVSLLALDGTLNQHEMQFLQDLCQRLEISQETKCTMLERVKQGKGRVHLPEDEADKKRLVYFLAQAVVTDGHIGQKERDVLNMVVGKLGLSLKHTELFIERRLKELKTERYSATTAASITCPKCGVVQNSAFQCQRCGIIFEKYKQAVGPTETEQLMSMLSATNKFVNK